MIKKDIMMSFVHGGKVMLGPLLRMPTTINDRSTTMTSQKTKTAANKRQPMPTP